jgi:hypothetical protein
MVKGNHFYIFISCSYDNCLILWKWSLKHLTFELIIVIDFFVGLDSSVGSEMDERVYGLNTALKRTIIQEDVSHHYTSLSGSVFIFKAR